MTPEQYDSWHDGPRGRWIGGAEYRMLHRLLDPQPGAHVLEVGCGTGWFTRRLAGDGIEVTGLDMDRAALEFARGHAAGNEQYVEGEACRLPFADGTFGSTLSVTALCFVERWPQAIGEIVRVSRRRFVLGLLNRHSVLWLRRGRKGGQGGYKGAHWHTRSEVAAVVTRLPVLRVRYRYGIFLPSGSVIARAWEQLIPAVLPLGSFMAVCGEIEPVQDGA